MSFEPTLIIRYSDLNKNKSKIEDEVYNYSILKPGTVLTDKKDRLKRAYEALGSALKLEPIEFPELTIVIITPEFTQHNRDVRKLLADLNIDYRIDI